MHENNRVDFSFSVLEHGIITKLFIGSFSFPFLLVPLTGSHTHKIKNNRSIEL